MGRSSGRRFRRALGLGRGILSAGLRLSELISSCALQALSRSENTTVDRMYTPL